MFNEEELREDGLSEEEIEILSDAFAFKETVDMLPDDIEAFIRECDKRIPENTADGMAYIFDMAEKDPEFFKKLMALDIVMSSSIDEIPENNSDSETSELLKLPPEQRKTVESNFFKTMANISGSEKKEFMKLMANLTPEQKSDLITRLSKK